MQLGFLTDGRTEDVAFATRHGFDCVELALFGDTALFDHHRPFKWTLREHGIGLAAVSLFGQSYFHADAAERQTAVERLRRAADLAVALGAPVLVAGSGRPPGASGEEQVAAAIAGMRPAIQEAQAKGLKFAYYNCSWENVIDRPSAWKRLLVELPGVGIKFDPSHPIQAGRDWKPELLAAGPHLVHAHAKDVLKVNGTFVADPNPGLGDIRWEEFFGILYHLGYDGAVCIEPHSPIYTGPRRYEFLKLSGQYLRRFFTEPVVV